MNKTLEHAIAAAARLPDDEQDWRIAAARRTWHTADATAVVVDAVRAAEMDPEHAHLDELMS